MVNKTNLCAIAAAISALSAGAANAQSVTLYGRVDVGVQYTTKRFALPAGPETVPNRKANRHLYEVANGGIRPSIWGLRGSEDLGGGLSAFFNLEAHFATDTGASTGPGAGRLGSGGFRRQANLGLKSDYGTLTIGRQYSPAILAALGTEPRAFKENLSGLYPYAFNQNPGGNTINDLGIFNGNAVSYSNTFGPFYAAGLVAAGEGTGKSYAGGFSYTGPVVVSLAGQKINQSLNGDDDEDGTTYYSAGIAVPLGAFTLKGQWQHSKEQGSVFLPDGSKVNSYAGGVDWAFNASNTLNLSYYWVKDKENKKDETKTLVVSDDYALSKRTIVYIQGAWADADDRSSSRTSIIASGVYPDKNTYLFGVGVSHNF